MVATLDIDITPAITHQGFSEEGTFSSLAADTYVEGTVLGRVTASGKWTPYVAGAADAVLEKSMDDLELSVRSRRALSRLGVNTLVDLIQKTEAELLGCKNFGVTSLNEIKDRLSTFGLGLRMLD